MATPHSNPDALPLLALKIAPRQFDLSYRFSNISLRDQLVRAQMLVRTLLDNQLVQKDARQADTHFQLLICGAGAAGMAAAMEARARGISFVLIEKDATAPNGVLGSTANRYVSTAMYEWPHPNHSQHDFPLAVPQLLSTAASGTPPSLPLTFAAPSRIADFAAAIGASATPLLKRWAANWGQFESKGKARSKYLFSSSTTISSPSKRKLKALLAPHASVHGAPLNDVLLPPLTLVRHHRTVPHSLTFDFIIYAVGFPAEATTYAKGKTPAFPFAHQPFWRPDQVQTPYLGFAGEPPEVLVLGSGDGALQDALRCLLTPQHPLDIWDALMRRKAVKEHPAVQAALARVAAADMYVTQGAIWTSSHQVYQSLDETFKAIVADLLAEVGRPLIHAMNIIVRNDVKSVTIVNQHGYFAKAYALNRFLIYLADACLMHRTSNGKGKLLIRSGEVTRFDALPGNDRGALVGIRRGGRTSAAHAYDLAILRGGLDHSDPPYQQLGLSGKDAGRAELGRIPVPIRPIG